MGLRILLSNDDGWDKFFIRVVYHTLVEAGHDVVLSAPLKEQSGKGSKDVKPNPEEGEPFGTEDGSGGRLNWVNSFPVTAVKYGIEKFGPRVWGGKPCDLVISGINYGWNVGRAVPMSGTVAVARWAATEAKVPAIAVSADLAIDGDENLDNEQAKIYASLVNQMVSTLVKSGRPLLPENVWLSVHTPSLQQLLPKISYFKWVLGLPSPHGIIITDPRDPPHDDKTLDRCDLDQLPWEGDVLKGGHGRIPVSINGPDFKDNVSKEHKQYVKDALMDILVCSEAGEGHGAAATTSTHLDA